MDQERVQRALDGLIYLPSLQGQQVLGSPSLSPHGKSKSPSKAATPRPWDRRDLLRRLRTFRATTWFCKPPAIAPIPCARRGWTNSALDMLSCEFCNSKLSFKLQPSLSHDQVQKAAEQFAARLETAHEEACPWRQRPCSPGMAQFPPLAARAVQADYAARLADLQRLSLLPPLAVKAVHLIMDTHRNRLRSLLNTPAPEEGDAHKGVLQPAGSEADDSEVDLNLLCRGFAEQGSVAHRQRAAVLAACGWSLLEVRAPSAKQRRLRCGTSAGEVEPAAPPEAGEAQKGREPVGLANAAVVCSECGARAGLWAFAPKGSAYARAGNPTAVAAPAAGSGERQAPKDRTAALSQPPEIQPTSSAPLVLVSLSSTIAGGSFEMDSSAEEQDPWGSTAPAFGTPQAQATGGVPSLASPSAMSGGSQAGTPVQPAGMAPLPGGTPAHQTPEDAGWGSPGSVPAFGLEVFRSQSWPPFATTTAAAAAAGAAASAGAKRKVAAEGGGADRCSKESPAAKKARRQPGASSITSAPAAECTDGALTGTPAAASSDAAEGAAEEIPPGQGAAPLNMVTLHRYFCPWMSSNATDGLPGEGGHSDSGRCGWRWCLEQLAPNVSDEGDGAGRGQRAPRGGF
eukprot:jgi/Astpho2/780/fgenesh1_pg.00016_%23_25_t